ncbi:MAG: glycosyltransferase [Candidatus Dormibacteraeota bacterium]|nr:glycosyltransferase [Candidatus Dormibacteraeota bacterium]
MQRVLEGRYRGVRIDHVRMNFSRGMDEVGRLRLRKVGHLLQLIVRVMAARLGFGSHALYYPPAGPERIPMYRDIILLLATRWMFRHTIFHFQASGLSEMYPRLGPLAKLLFRAAYYRADIGIRTDVFAPPDPARLRSRREALIPNALEDVAAQTPRDPTFLANPPVPTILFVGVVRESKGVLDLIRASALLHRRGINFRLQVVGQFESDSFEKAARQLAEREEVPAEFGGVLIGELKYKAYAHASVFCLPSYYASEASPVVLIEAMQFGLPIVSTQWRGIPSMIEEGYNGFLVPIRDADALADRLSILLLDPAMARRIGENGRQRFEEKFTLTAFQSSIQQVFDGLAEKS